MTRPRDRFAAWREQQEAALARHKPERVTTHLFDGAQVIGTVDRVGLRYESYRASGQYIGRHANWDQAVEAVHSAHKTARIVTGIVG